jgi:hypothetical protein
MSELTITDAQVHRRARNGPERPWRPADGSSAHADEYTVEQLA